MFTDGFRKRNFAHQKAVQSHERKCPALKSVKVPKDKKKEKIPASKHPEAPPKKEAKKNITDDILMIEQKKSRLRNLRARNLRKLYRYS